MARPGIWYLIEYHKPLPITVYQYTEGAEIHLKTRVVQKWRLYNYLTFIASSDRCEIFLGAGVATMYSCDAGSAQVCSLGGTIQRPGSGLLDASVEECWSIIKEEYRNMVKIEN